MNRDLSTHTGHKIGMSTYHSYARRPIVLGRIIVYCETCEEILQVIE